MYSFKVWGRGHSNEPIIIPEAVDLIRRWELFIPHWYPDGFRPDGSIIWSCCFGHAEGGDNPPFKMTEGETFTLEQGNAILAKDIESKHRYVRARVTVPLTTFMRGSITSLVYQYGNGRIDDAAEADLFLPTLNKGRYVRAFCEMLQLNKKRDGTLSDGHTLRRAAEVGFAMTRID